MKTFYFQVPTSDIILHKLLVIYIKKTGHNTKYYLAQKVLGKTFYTPGYI